MSSSEDALRVRGEVARRATELREMTDELLAEGVAHGMSDEAVQKLMTAAVKLYVAKVEEGSRTSPFTEGEVTATEVVVTVSEMLRAVEVEVFELGMWQVWGGT